MYSAYEFSCFLVRRIKWVLLFLLSNFQAQSSTSHIKIPITIDRTLCDELLVNSPNDPDIAYQEGLDVEGNLVEPANLPDSIRLSLPEKISIPINVDLGKYYRQASPKSTKDLNNVLTNQQLINTIQQKFSLNSATVTAETTKVSDALKELKLKITANTLQNGIITPPQAKEQFDIVDKSFNTITAALHSNNTALHSVSDPLESNLNILRKTVNDERLEKDVIFVQTTQNFLKESSNTITTVEANLTRNQNATDEAVQLFSQVNSLLENESTKVLLGSKVEGIQTKLNSLNERLTRLQINSSSSPLNANLKTLKESFLNLATTQLNNYNQINYVPQKAEIGIVKFNLNTGRVTFNDQPISNEETDEIVKKCREMINSSKPSTAK